MDYAQFNEIKVSRFILGSNPFSGFSHQSPARDVEMRHFFTTTHIKDTLRHAEELGVNTLIARSDYHVMRMLMEYRDEGGALQWFAQTCPEVGSHEACILRAHANGAKAVHLHGGVMDNAYAQGKLNDVPAAIDLIHEKGMLAGIAAHNHKVTPGPRNTWTWIIICAAITTPSAATNTPNTTQTHQSSTLKRTGNR